MSRERWGLDEVIVAAVVILLLASGAADLLRERWKQEAARRQHANPCEVRP